MTKDQYHDENIFTRAFTNIIYDDYVNNGQYSLRELVKVAVTSLSFHFESGGSRFRGLENKTINVMCGLCVLPMLPNCKVKYFSLYCYHRVYIFNFHFKILINTLIRFYFCFRLCTPLSRSSHYSSEPKLHPLLLALAWLGFFILLDSFKILNTATRSKLVLISFTNSFHSSSSDGD